MPAAPMLTRIAPRFVFAALVILALAAGASAQVGVLAPTAAVAPRRVPVVWVIGQSNAEGATAGYWLANPLGTGAPYFHLSSQPGVRIWWPGPSLQRPSAPPSWEGYRVGSLAPANNGSFFIVEGTFGPEASIGDAASARFGEVFVFKFTWVARLDPRAVPTFSKQQPASAGLYGVMMGLWQAAAADLRAQNLAPDLEGIVWIQGEGDCFANGHTDRLLYARAYEANLTRFIADLRADLAVPGRPSIPFVISQLHDRHLPRSTWATAEAMIRGAQARVAAADPMVELTGTDTLTLDPHPGQVHFDATGTVLLGYALFGSLAQMLPP